MLMNPISISPAVRAASTRSAAVLRQLNSQLLFGSRLGDILYSDEESKSMGPGPHDC
jgi:hypothetical protein